MKLTIDTDRTILVHESGGNAETLPLYSDRAFDLIAEQWVHVGWNQRYSYTFSWMGRPIIQLPEDMIRTQEVIHRVRPDVIVETGVAHGGSLVYYASLCRMLGIEVELVSPVPAVAIEAKCEWITTETAPSTKTRPDPAHHNLCLFGFTEAYLRPTYITAQSIKRVQ